MDILTVHVLVVPLTILVGVGIGWWLRGWVNQTHQGEQREFRLDGDPEEDRR